MLHKQLEDGDAPLYLLSMIAYQFRNLLIIKELQDARTPYNIMAKKSGLASFCGSEKLLYVQPIFYAETKKNLPEDFSGRFGY